MKIRIKIAMLIIATLGLFAGCGGGSDQAATTGPSTVSTVDGTASTGLIKNGAVNIYAALNNGSKGGLLATAATDGQGHYSAAVANYVGPVIIEVSGSYLDEATGQTRTVEPTAPLRAAASLPGGGSVSIAVTPLTDLAYRKALAAVSSGTDLTKAITYGNLRTSETIAIKDITTVQPVDATQAALQTATDDQRTYTLALAAISQLARERDLSIYDVIANLNAAGDGASSQITGGLNNFLASNTNNQTGYRRIALNLSLAGGSQKVGALDFIITLPNGVLANTDPTGALAQSEFTLVAAGGSPQTATKYLPGSAGTPAILHMIIVTTDPLSDGTFGTIQFNVPSAVQAGDFQVQSVTAKDQNTATIAGVTVALQ